MDKPSENYKPLPVQLPKVGVATIVADRNHKLLLAERFSSHERGKFGCPGGKVDLWESPREAAIREIKEETGLMFQESAVFALPLVANCLYRSEPNHFICLWFALELFIDAPNISFIEKDGEGRPKSGPWQWHSHDDLRKMPLMGTTLAAYEKVLRCDMHYEMLNYEV